MMAPDIDRRGRFTWEFGDLEVTINAPVVERGGPGSGHFGHKGRPGQRGGSLPNKSITKIFRVPNSERWSDVRDALDAIDSVHTVADSLRMLPLKESKAYLTGGKYRYQQYRDGTPIAPLDMFVVLGQEGEGTIRSMVHETGHYIDHMMLGEALKFASDVPPTPAMQKWWDAVQASQSYQDLQKFPSGIVRMELNGVTHIMSYDFDFLRNVNNRHEFFARSYTQWIAVRSGNERLRRAILFDRDIDEAGGPPLAWQDDEFEPIAEALDDVFAEGGWLK